MDAGALDDKRDSAGPYAVSADAEIGAGSVVGPYRVLRLLATGGMGRVFLARDVRLGRLVALKFASESLASDAAARAQFVLEARATAQLSHPNVVTLFDVGERADVPWAAYEYIEGTTLATRLRQGPLPFDEVLRVGRGLATGLAAAHAAGILHRDMKPANVILGNDGRARILDFGIVRFVGPTDAPRDSHQSEMMFVGTPAYMAPEQWRGQDAAATDVWALGLILHEALTGTNPLRGVDHSVLALRAAEGTLLDQPVALSRFPAEIASLVTRCLANDPSQRPSAKEVSELLASIEQGTPTPVSQSAEPYPGAQAFDDSRASVFFGRDRDVDALVRLLDERGLVWVVGAAGSGKTSLIRAGLLPRLRTRRRTLEIVVTAGPAPLGRLAHALVETHGSASSPSAESEPTLVDNHRERVSATTIRLDRADELERALRERPEQLAVALERLGERHNASRVVLWVDELENLLASATDPEERKVFLSAMTSAVAGTEERARVVLSVRDEELGRLSSITSRAFSSLFHLDPPGGDLLRAALVEPASRSGLVFDEPALVEEIVSDALGAEEPLTYLQCAASSLWSVRDVRQRMLTRAGYDQTVRAGGALARHAERVIEAFAPEQLDAARGILVELAGARGARVLVARTDLAARYGEVANVALDALVRARLLTQRDGDRVQITFARLAREWPRLARWIESSDPDAKAIRDLTDVAERWRARGERQDELWRGLALTDAADLVRRRPAAFGEIVTRFVAAGHAVERRSLRTRNAVRAGLTGSVLLVAVAATVAAWALRTREREAQGARRRAEADRVELLVQGARVRQDGGDPLTARAMIRTALEQGDSVEGRAVFASLLRNPELWSREVRGIAYRARFTPSGDQAFVALQTGEIWRMDIASGTHVALRGHTDQVITLDVAGNTVFSASWSGELWTWDATSTVGRELRRFGSPALRIAAVPDGRVVAARTDGRAIVIDPSGRRADLEFEHGDPYPLGIGVDARGGTVAIGGRSRRIRWFDLDDGHLVGEVETPGTVTALAAMGGDRRVAAAAGNGRILIAHPGVIEAEHGVSSAGVRALAVAEDRYVMTGSGRGEFSLLDLTTREVRTATLPDTIFGIDVHGRNALIATTRDIHARRWDLAPSPPASPPMGSASVAYSPDGSFVYGAGTGIRVVDARTGREVSRFVVSEGASADIRDLTISPDGSMLAGTYPGIGAFVMDAHSGATRVIVGQAGVTVRSLDADFPGDLLATGDDSGRLVLARASTGETIAVLSRPSSSVIGARFTHDPSFVDVAYADGSIWRWNTANRTSRTLRDGDGQATSFVRSPSSRRLALVTPNGIEVLDGASGQAERHLPSPGTRLYDGAFDPAEDRLALAGADGRVHVWDLSTGDHRAFDAHDREANSVAFDPSGRFVASVGDDGPVRLFEVATGRPMWWYAGAVESQDDPEQIRFAVRGAGRVRCVLRRDGTLVRESPEGRRTGTLAGATDVASGAGVCAASDGTHVLRVTGGESSIIDVTHARLAGTDSELWIADDAHLRAFDAGGRLLRTYPSPSRLGAFTPLANGFVTATEDWIEWHDGSGGTVARVPGIAGPKPVLVAEGPFGSIVVGYLDGRACAWVRGESAPFDCRSLRGRIVEAHVDGASIHLASALDDHAVMDLSVLGESRCEVLRTVWREIPLVWADGDTVLRSPPSQCRP